MSTARMQALFAKACLGTPEETRALEVDPARFLAEHGLDAEDAEAMRGDARRLALYRRLVRHNVVNVVHAMLERTRARFDVVRPGLFDATVDAFLAEVGPRTPHLRDVPAEVLAFAAPRWKAEASVPVWLLEHAELELVEFTIGIAPRAGDVGELVDVSPDRPLAFVEPTAIVRTTHAVHELAAGDPRAEPAARDVALLVYRDAAHQTRFLELSPLASAILERLLSGSPLAGAMVLACEATGATLDDGVLAGAARLLADLAERGVLLGARPLATT